MSKKDGLEIFELFRSGSGKSGTAEATPPPAVKERVTTIRPAPAPAPAPVAAAPAPAPKKASPGEATISVRLNTALVGLMVGTACLFGCFALGVQYERRHHAAAAETARAPEEPQPTPIPVTPREVRRETPPPTAPAENHAAAPAPADPKKGYTLQLMSYGADQESIAQRMLKKVRDQKGDEASLIKDKNGNFIVIAGFVEKQTGADAESLLSKYRGMASRTNFSFNLNWIPASK